jgi:hypothetical protein
MGPLRDIDLDLDGCYPWNIGREGPSWTPVGRSRISEEQTDDL